MHLSRLRGRSHRIGRYEAGGGNSLHTNSATRGDTPHPTLPRTRQRECSLFADIIQRATLNHEQNKIGRTIMNDMSKLEPWQWPEAHWRGLVNQVRGGRLYRPKSWKNGARCAF